MINRLLLPHYAPWPWADKRGEPWPGRTPGPHTLLLLTTSE
ncbi:MAG TPA: hypothetical protein P5121_31845 [Caldilineaceae bacterium]|nr:hypothetical protein [Caldilineaceae bacterium]